MAETLGHWTRRLLLAANVSMVVVIVADLFYLTNMVTVDLPSFTLLNLVVLGLGLWSFKVKRDLRARIQSGGAGDAGPAEEPGSKGEKTG